MELIKKLFGKKWDQEGINIFEGEELGMRNAIQEAQKHFPQFIEEMKLESRRIVPAFEECFIKYAFKAEKQGLAYEHMFVTELYHDGSQLTGVLASSPQYTDAVVEGDKIIVKPEMVSDWLFVLNGEAKGGFTFVYMWHCFSKEERQMYVNEAPFFYLGLTV